MMIQSDFHIFQGGWNHQLVNCCHNLSGQLHQKSMVFDNFPQRLAGVSSMFGPNHTGKTLSRSVGQMAPIYLFFAIPFKRHEDWLAQAVCPFLLHRGPFPFLGLSTPGTVGVVHAVAMFGLGERLQFTRRDPFSCPKAGLPVLGSIYNVGTHTYPKIWTIFNIIWSSPSQICHFKNDLSMNH